MIEEKRLVGDVYYPTPATVASAHIRDYEEVQRAAAADPIRFWRRIASEDFEWYQPWEKVLDESNAPFFRWFAGARLNLIHNALDRHMRTAVRNKAALIFEGEPGDSQVYTYRQLNHVVCKFASVLRSMGVTKGDIVTIFMGRIPEQIIAMLACAKIGGIHSVVSCDVSIAALRARMNSSGSKMLITSDGAWSRGNIVGIKKIANEALSEASGIQSVICVRRTGQDVEMIPGRDYWFHELMALPIADPKASTEVMDADDPLFILHEQPEGVEARAIQHTHGGYMVGVRTTLKWIFDIKPEDVWWCTAELSHVVGHSYVVYGPLMLGATSFLYEGDASYPYPDRWWRMVARYSVTTFCTMATSIRNLVRFGENWPKGHDLTSLRLLGIAGDMIDAEAWKWFYNVIGRGECQVMDCWITAETGSILIAPLPSLPVKPGSPARPFPGVQIDVVDESGESVAADQLGRLVVTTPWPAMFTRIYGDTDFYVTRYWDEFREQGWYVPGVSAFKDDDGYLWITDKLPDIKARQGNHIPDERETV